MSKAPPRLVQRIHEELASVIEPGSWVIDATVGNGYDTHFLANAVGPSGKVIGFDIQQSAIETTQALLLKDQLAEHVSLHQTGHEHMLQVVPESWLLGVQAIMFNLGYCPGGDKSIITQPGTTLQALESAHELLAFGGNLSIVIYSAHEGGAAEAEAVTEWIDRLDPNEYDFIYETTLNNGPEWYCLQKKGRAV